MLKIEKLHISNIGRFIEEQTIDFTSLGNIVQIDGINNNTGGSSGSGKSTILNALDYLLGINDLPTTVLQSRLTKEAISVSGEFKFNDKPLTISRNKKGLTIDLDGQITEGSSKLTEEKLDEILGISKDLFRKILHKRQKEGGFFLELKPKEMYDFLVDVLNLSVERKKLEIIENKISELKLVKISKESLVQSSQASLSAAKDALLSIGLPPTKEVDQSTVLDLKSKHDKSLDLLNKTLENHKIQNDLLDKERPSLIPNPILESVPTIDKPSLLNNELDNKQIILSLESKVLELNSNISSLKEEDNVRIKKINETIQSHKMMIMSLNHKCDFANSAKSEAIKIAGEIKKIRDSICPTCEQSWVTEAAKTKENEYLLKLKTYESTIKDGLTSKNQIDELNIQIESLEKELVPKNSSTITSLIAETVQYNEQISIEKKKALDYRVEINNKNAELLNQYNEKQNSINKEVSIRNEALLADVSSRNKVLQDDYQNKVKAVRAAQEKELESIRGQADVDRRSFDAAVAKLSSYNESLKRYESTLNSLKYKESEYLKDFDKNNSELVKINEQLEIAEELKKSIKLFISISFDDALDYIGETSTKIIRCIPTMNNATIQLDGQKETKDGKVKEEVNAIISMDGEIGIPIKSLSGGERSAVDLAIDMAVIDLIENQSNIGIDLIALDEPFTGLDTTGVEMVLEVLKNYNSNKRILIIDHNPEVKQMVSDRLVVVRDGLYSKILTGGN